MSNDSTLWNSDFRQYLKNIRISKINKLILGNLNINSVLYKKQI